MLLCLCVGICNGGPLTSACPTSFPLTVVPKITLRPVEFSRANTVVGDFSGDGQSDFALVQPEYIRFFVEVCMSAGRCAMPQC